MKRILLTTTSLILAAGVASAEITFSGTAGIALIDDNGASVAGTATNTSLVAAAQTAADASTAATAAAAANVTATATTLLAAEATYAAIATPTDAQTLTMTNATTAYATAQGVATDANVILNNNALAAGRSSVSAATAATAANTARAAGPAAPNAAARATRDGMFFESYYDLDVSVSAESDNGITVALGFDMGSGNKIDYDDDDQLEAQGASIGNADVSVSYAGWTVAVDQDGIDNLYDDGQQEDMSVSGSIAGMSVAFTTDQENTTSSYSVSGTVAGVALTATGTDNDAAGGSASKISASYAMGALTLSGSVADESDNGEDDQTVGVKYAIDGLTFGYTSIKPGSTGSFGDEWDFSVGYAAGAVAASFATDEASATTLILDYSLGGGASAFAAMHDKAGTDNDLTALGLTFAF